MLRITLSAGDSAVLALEGRLTGPWAEELLRVTHQVGAGPTSVFDLEGVFYADSLGEESLRVLSGRGARFITESAYGKDLCERLELDRIKSSDVAVGASRLRNKSSSEKKDS